MKKFINISFAYAIAALAGGVFYREFTKLSGFVGKTQLSVVHTHLFVLGMVMFLLLALFERTFAITESRKYGPFVITYNIGVIWTVCMFIWHGVYQVLGIPAGAMIAGLAGIGHIIFTVSIVFFFLMLKERVGAVART